MIRLFARLCDGEVTVSSEVRYMQRRGHNSKAIDPAGNEADAGFLRPARCEKLAF